MSLKVRALVIDEADHLLAPPNSDEITSLIDAMPFFKPNIREISSSNEFGTIPSAAQIKPMASNHTTFLCLCSATGSTNPNVLEFAKTHFRSGWRMVSTDSSEAMPPTLTHAVISVPRLRQLEFLRRLLNAQPKITSAIIFVNDPQRVRVVCEKLNEQNFLVSPLHGETSKEERKVCTTGFRFHICTN
jgi:superfamily II DNA/RNA helicase